MIHLSLSLIWFSVLSLGRRIQAKKIVVAFERTSPEFQLRARSWGRAVVQTKIQLFSRFLHSSSHQHQHQPTSHQYHYQHHQPNNHDGHLGSEEVDNTVPHSLEKIKLEKIWDSRTAFEKLMKDSAAKPVQREACNLKFNKNKLKTAALEELRVKVSFGWKCDGKELLKKWDICLWKCESENFFSNWVHLGGWCFYKECDDQLRTGDDDIKTDWFNDADFKYIQP